MLPLSVPRRGVTIELLWLATGQGVAVLAALTGVSWLTRFLEPRAYGEFALAITTANLLGLTIIGPVAAAASRYVTSVSERRDTVSLLAATQRLALHRAGVVMLLGVIAAAGMLIVR